MNVLQSNNFFEKNEFFPLMYVNLPNNLNKLRNYF